MKNLKTIATLTFVFFLFSCQNSAKKQEDKRKKEKFEAQEPIPDPAHNTRNSLDWNGTYEGIFPCVDCVGLKTSVTLNSDNTYSRSEAYINDKSDAKLVEKGSFTWDSTGSFVLLDGKSANNRYQVVENRLLRLETVKKVDVIKEELFKQ